MIQLLDLRREEFFFADAVNRSTNVYGLLPGKKYIVQVRCDHKGYFDFGANPTYKRETNVNYIEVETLSGGTSSLSFNSSLFEVQRADGANGLNTLKAMCLRQKGPSTTIDFITPGMKSANLIPAWTIWWTSTMSKPCLLELVPAFVREIRLN